VAGGDGVDYLSLLDGRYSWGSLKPIQQPVVTELEQAAEVLPEFRFVPGLQTITLGATAFAVGWKIGSALNTRWLHLNGEGLGTSGTFDTIDVQPQWVHATDLSQIQPYFPAIDGYYLKFSNTTGNRSITYCDSTPVYTDGIQQCPQISGLTQAASTRLFNADYDYAVARFPANIVWKSGTNCPQQCFPSGGVILTDTQFEQALAVDQPLQSYTGQPAGVSTGWADPGSGAGVTTTAPTYPNGPSNPNPQKDPVRVITDGFLDAWRNEINCRLDPTDFECPTTNPDGTEYTSDGGQIVAVPTCYGMMVAACEDAVSANGGNVDFTVAIADSPDPGVADGRVAATTPSSRVLGNPTTVTITTNPANGNPEGCTSETENPHWSPPERAGSVLAKGRVTCNYTGSVDVEMTLWKCAEPPFGDPVSLAAGEWGCSPAALTAKSVSVIAAVTATVYVPDVGAPAVYGDAYFIAQTDLPTAPISWSQDGWWVAQE
jgi:hypothetical protein